MHPASAGRGNPRLAVRAVFLDRDGVINRKPPEGDYVKSWEEFEFLPGASKAIARLKRCGFRVIVVSNQRGISLGKLCEEELRAIHARMRAELQKAGATLDAIYYCPHAHNSCKCRKPEVGMFLEARRDFPDIDFSRSFVVGDSTADMEAAARLGSKKVLIGERAATIAPALAEKRIRVDFTAPSLNEAVKELLRSAGARRPERFASASSRG